jgi:hypothetical protein
MRGNTKAPPSMSASELIESYWAGADSSGMSRVESLQAAFALKPERDSAKLAGLLAHSALPSLAGSTSLDSVLVARAAAWLCIAESALKNREQADDALWTPILFLAARENAAWEAWKKSRASKESAAWQWWNFLAQRPRSKDVFLFAADHRQFAMPMLVYESRLIGFHALLADVAGALFGGERSFPRLYDYGAFFELKSGVCGGRMAEGAFPAFARGAWLDCASPSNADQRTSLGDRQGDLSETVAVSRSCEMVGTADASQSLEPLPKSVCRRDVEMTTITEHPLDVQTRRQIARSLLGAVDERGYCVCPGHILHTNKSAPFRSHRPGPAI